MYMVVFEKTIRGNYWRTAWNNERLDTLSYFLIDCDLFYTNRLIDWLCGEYPDIEGMGVVQKEEGFIIVDYEFNPNPEDYSQAFITTEQGLLDILIKWENILKISPRPNQIFFTQEDDIVTITAKNR
jgi:hypothetical protein